MKNQKLAEFFRAEIKSLIEKMGSRGQIAGQIGVSPSLIHAYYHGDARPTIQTILKLAALNEKVIGEKIESFCDRWCTVYGRKYLGKNMDKLLVALRKEPLIKVHNANLMPIIQTITSTNLGEITLSEIDFLLVTEEKIGYKLSPEIILNLLKLRKQTNNSTKG